MNTAPRSAAAAVEAGLAGLRADDRRRLAVIVAGVLLGLGLGWVHWFGLVVGGALVALPVRTVPRGLALGLGLGLLALAVFAAVLAANDALGPVLSTGTVAGLSAGVGLAAPLLGSLARAIA